MAIPTPILELVERFKASRDACRSAAYNEEQCRAGFINSFFLALGWDMESKKRKPAAVTASKMDLPAVTAPMQ